MTPVFRSRTTLPALAVAAAILSGCVQPAVAPPPTAPVVPAVPRVAAPRVIVTPPPAVPALPPVPTGPVDGRSGLHQASVISITGDADSRFTLLFRPAQTEPSRIEGAPAKLCGDRGVANSRTNTPGAGSAMPGVQMMIVTCTAA